MKKIKESALYNRSFGDIIKATTDDYCLVDSRSFDQIIRRKRLILQTKREFPLDDIKEICRKAGNESIKTFRHWYKDDEEFRNSYEIITNFLNDYLMELYGKYRTSKQLN